MGLLTKALRIAHPVRTAKRSVKRAVTPRPIRRALSIKNAVAHPVSHLEYGAIGALDRAITPRARTHRSGGGCVAVFFLLGLAGIAFALTVNHPIVMLPIWGVIAAVAIAYPLARRHQRKHAELDVAKRRLYTITKDTEKVVDRLLAQSTSEVQRQGISGWWVELGRNYERLVAGDKSAAAGYNLAIECLTQWSVWKPVMCANCAAPDQTAGHPCGYCGKVAQPA